MPLSTLAKAGIAAAVAGGAWAWSDREAKRRKKAKRAPTLPSHLVGIYGPRQALIPDIYNNLNVNGQRTADQFFGFNLTPEAQGKLFELLAEIYTGDIQTYVGDAAVAALSELQPAEWGVLATGSLATQEVFESTEALAMVVLADIQDVVIPFEQPPLDPVIDHEADLCVREIYALAPVALHPEILPELSEVAAEIGRAETFHLNDVAQATAFLHLTSLAANEPGVWMTAPIVSTLRAVAPGCAWERKDHYTSQMSDVYYDVEALRDIVQADIGFQPEPSPEPAPRKVGDIVAQGTVGPVQWRVVWAYEAGNPNSPRPLYGPSETRDVYDGEFWDSKEPIFGTGFEPFGAGYFDLNRAIEETRKLAQERPWAE